MMSIGGGLAGLSLAASALVSGPAISALDAALLTNTRAISDVAGTAPLKVGNPASVVNANAGDIVTPNARGLRGNNAAGNTTYSVARISATDVVSIDADARGSVFGGAITSGDSVTVGGAGVLSFLGGTAQATTGHIRLPNNVALGWRNAANTGNVTLTLDNTDLFRFSGGVVVAPTLTAGAYAAQVVGASGAARDILLVGQSGFSNGFTVQYDGTRMQYKLLDGNTVLGGDLTVTSLNNGITSLSGNAANVAAYRLGRTASEGAFFVAGVANDFITGTAQADMGISWPAANAFLMGPGNSRVVRISSGGIVQFNTAQATSANIGDTVHSNARGPRGVNNAATNTIGFAWIDSNDRVVLSPNGNDIAWGVAQIASGGGAAPTFGTIGGSGPTAAAQSGWLKIFNSAGAARFLPVWA